MSNWETAQALLASAAQTTSGASAAVDLGTRDRLLRQTLSVVAASGDAPSLLVSIESSPDGVTGWRKVGQFTAASAPSVERSTFISLDRYVRVAWTISGTGSPSFTFGVDGTRGIVYANLDDLDEHGVPSVAVSKMPAPKRCSALAAASEEMSSKLGVRYDLPLAAWGIDLTKACCKIAGYELLSVIGFNPEGHDQNVRDRARDAWRWLDDVASGDANPVGIVDSSPTVEDDGVAVVTHASRGWR